MLQPLHREKPPLRDPDGPKCKLCKRVPVDSAYGDICEDCAVGGWRCARSAFSTKLYGKGEEREQENYARIIALPPDARIALPISELRLSIRLENYFGGRGIASVGDLVMLTEQEIGSMHGLGEGYVAETKQALSRIGLRLRPNPES